MSTECLAAEIIVGDTLLDYGTVTGVWPNHDSVDEGQILIRVGRDELVLNGGEYVRYTS